MPSVVANKQSKCKQKHRTLDHLQKEPFSGQTSAKLVLESYRYGRSHDEDKPGMEAM